MAFKVSFKILKAIDFNGFITYHLIFLSSNTPSPHGSIAPDGGQIIGQSTENQPVRSRKHIHSHFDLKIAIFSTALVLGNRSMCLFLLYNAGAQIFQSPQDFALREDVRKSVISHPLNSTAAGSDTCLFRVRSPAQ